MTTFAPLVPELYVTNLKRSLSFYLDLLHFTVRYARPEEGFAFLELGGAHLMLEETSSLDASSADDFQKGRWRSGKLAYPFGRGVNFEIAVPSVETLANRLRGAGYPLLLEPQTKWYCVQNQLISSKRMLVADPDGYLLRFSETLDEQAAKAQKQPLGGREARMRRQV